MSSTGRYSCSGCSATYYCKISRNLKIHYNEHLGIGKSSSLLNSPNSSAIWQNMKQTGHVGFLDDFSITSRTCTLLTFLYKKLFVCKVQRHNRCLNSKQSSFPKFSFRHFSLCPLFYYRFFTISLPVFVHLSAYTCPLNIFEK